MTLTEPEAEFLFACEKKESLSGLSKMLILPLMTCPLIRLLRWHVPTGAGLLFLPSLWGLTAATRGLPSLKLVLLFGLGAFFMRSAGCIYNDWVDQDLDRQVTRTRTRPLAEGSLSSFTAFGTIFFLLLASLGVVMQLNLSALIVSFSFATLVLAYPWLKRITYWPQVYLGILFSSGVWVGWFAVKPAFADVTVFPFILYMIGILWTLAYDTIYAYQDYQDDAKMGLKSSALWLGDSPISFFYGCWGMILGLLGLLGYLESLHWGYGLGLLFIGFHFLWQTFHLKGKPAEYPQMCARLFKANQWIGVLIFLSLWVGF